MASVDKVVEKEEVLEMQLRSMVSYESPVQLDKKILDIMTDIDSTQEMAESCNVRSDIQPGLLKLGAALNKGKTHETNGKIQRKAPSKLPKLTLHHSLESPRTGRDIFGRNKHSN